MSFDRCVFGPLFGVTYNNQFFSICVRIFVGVDLRLRGPAAGRVALAGPNGMVHAWVGQIVTFGQYGVPACPWAIFEP